MKKIYLNILILLVLLNYGCSNETTEGVSDVTNFAIITLEGNAEEFVHQGEPYEEPGANAVEAGSSVTVNTTSTGLFTGGPLDTDVPDIYSIMYSAVNSDGYSSSNIRSVIVAETGNLTDNISGVYVSTVVRDGVASADYENLHYVLIWQNADGTYELSDGVGGYYMYGRSYGINYAAGGATVTVNGLNDYAFGPAFGVGAFGGTANITEMAVDPDNKTIDLTTSWDTGSTVYSFAIHLQQVQF